MITRIAFIGFGVVGQGLAEILLEQKNDLKNQIGFEFEVVAVSDKMKGSVYNEVGLDLQKLLEFLDLKLVFQRLNHQKGFSQRLRY